MVCCFDSSRSSADAINPEPQKTVALDEEPAPLAEMTSAETAPSADEASAAARSFDQLLNQTYAQDVVAPVFPHAIFLMKHRNGIEDVVGESVTWLSDGL